MALACKRLMVGGENKSLKIMAALIIPTLGSMVVIGGSSLGLILLIVIIVLLVR